MKIINPAEKRMTPQTRKGIGVYSSVHVWPRDIAWHTVPGPLRAFRLAMEKRLDLGYAVNLPRPTRSKTAASEPS
ncbi:hypothetical protein ACGFNV_36230 [Streptomyces sp. NPDC048751]|uniref:hypothetical protein n=1 Tax=Streptomyces sp. NPDC048751 TaxID=3365591 RepID=UPI00371ED86E